ncbi:MAG: hypothetical protein AAFP22_22855, partial [Planctomycetota bacterium]
PVHVVEPGVDAAPPSPARRPGETCRLVSVGGLTTRKAHDDAANALSGLTELDWTWTVVGRTDQESACADALLTRVAADGLRSRVEITGELDDASRQLMVRGAIVELAQNADWATAFARTLTAPLGLGDPGLAYVTLPQQAIGTHPLVAGGLRATMTEYAAFLTLVLDEGRLPSGEPWIAEASIDRLFDNPWAGATMLTWPMDTYGFDYHYGFGTWLECPGPVATCDVMSSPGAFGFTPWVDRARGYFGILAMESAGPGGAGFSVQLVQSMRPTIEALVEAADPG